MIYYFSATGNSKYMATRRQEDNGTLVSVTDAAAMVKAHGDKNTDVVEESSKVKNKKGREQYE